MVLVHKTRRYGLLRHGLPFCNPRYRFMTGYGRFGPEPGLVSQPQLSASISDSPDGPPGATLSIYSGFRALWTQIVFSQ
jgi:hypothetical protein